MLTLLASLWTAFATPSQASKPWTYWFWPNSLTDRETMTEELADIANLGFGGILLTDSRGYWDDEDHVKNPPPTIRWGGDEWRGLLAHGFREAAKHGLKVMVNIAASGGHLRGDSDVGADSPKFLKCRRYLPGESFERPDIPNYHDVAVFAVRTAESAERSDWTNAGDGFMTMVGNLGRREDAAELPIRRALEVRELGDAAQGAALGRNWTVLRIGWGTQSGREVDIDVLDAQAVRRHLDRVFGPLCAQMPELVGEDRPFAGLYNVSWEGMMPTWSVSFEREFAADAGYALRPYLPILAGFDMAEMPRQRFMRDFRHARGVMMKNNLYGAVREWAHEHRMFASSESGGPWGRGKRNPATFGECDQLAFLAANDVPQGEFWPCEEKGLDGSGHAVRYVRTLDRAVASAAHIYDLPIAAAEAFTHVNRHWSVDPAFLKPVGDQVFANGINRFVWHTYTTSPRRFGCPGLEYFAGSHINRNVTWHDDLAPMIRYLHRCQALLQRGKPVADVALLCGDRPYLDWGYTAGGPVRGNGLHRQDAALGFGVTVPRGYASDLVNDDALMRNPKLLERYALVYDCRPATNQNKRIDMGALKPDVETAADWAWCHRRDDSADWYFIAGEGRAEVIFRVAAPSVEIWNAVTATRMTADASPLADGRTRVRLDLPVGGSCFVVFGQCEGSPEPMVRKFEASDILDVNGPWKVAFAYHPSVSAVPPKPVTLDRLVDFTTRDDLRHFAGTAAYRTTINLSLPLTSRTSRSILSLGEVPSGLAHVFVNGVDCGTVWCAPWEADVSKAVKPGANNLEIRYVNNWYNRLVGDCFLEEADRVTKSVLRYWRKPRTGNVRNFRTLRPTVFSGYSSFDALQPSGLLGPVRLKIEARCGEGEGL